MARDTCASTLSKRVIIGYETHGNKHVHVYTCKWDLTFTAVGVEERVTNVPAAS